MLPAEAIREAKKLIEAGWMQSGPGHFGHAQDAEGRPVALHIGDDRLRINPEAVAFTAYGAIATVMRRERVLRTALVFDVLYRLASETAPPLGGNNYVHPLLAFNEAEGRTQAEVADLFERAAVQCEEVGEGPFPSPIPLPSAESMRGPG